MKVTYKDVANIRQVHIHFHKEERLGTGTIKFEYPCSFKAQNQEADLDILIPLVWIPVSIMVGHHAVCS